MTRRKATQPEAGSTVHDYVADTLTASGIKIEDLDENQLQRACAAGTLRPGIRGKALERWIMDGLSLQDQVREAERYRAVRNIEISVPRSNFRPLIAELEVIASEELAEVLEVVTTGGTLSTDQATKLRAYLISEVESGGMLTAQVKLEAGLAISTSHGIERQAKKLARRLASELGEDDS